MNSVIHFVTLMRLYRYHRISGLTAKNALLSAHNNLARTM